MSQTSPPPTRTPPLSITEMLRQLESELAEAGVDTPALDARALVKDYAGRRALAGLFLWVRPGEVVGLLGPNGAGKSTTMKLAAGVLHPTAGELRIMGERLNGGAVAPRRHIGYVPDVDGLYPRLTGWEHLELVAGAHGLDNWEERARTLLDVLGLSSAAGRRASTYSHGMSRKLCLSLALLSKPPLLLLDEPFDGVDPAGAAAVRSLVLNARDEGAGVLVSTHLLSTSELLCDRLVIIRNGAQVAAGTPAQLREYARAETLEQAYLTIMKAAGSPLGAQG